MSDTEFWMSMVSRWHHREEFGALALALRRVGVKATLGPGRIEFQGDGLWVMMHTVDTPKMHVNCAAGIHIDGWPQYWADVTTGSPLTTFEAIRSTERDGRTIGDWFPWLKGVSV